LVGPSRFLSPLATAWVDKKATRATLIQALSRHFIGFHMTRLLTKHGHFPKFSQKEASMDESADRFQNAIDTAIEAQIREAFALKDEDELGEALNAIYVAATDGALRALLSLGCPLEDVEGEMQRLVKALVKEHAEDMPSLQ
jgi:hypothetical protein